MSQSLVESIELNFDTYVATIFDLLSMDLNHYGRFVL